MKKCDIYPLRSQFTVSTLYYFISQKYPFYKMKDQGWQNSIRHNLSLNKGFENVPNSNEGGRGNRWRMKEGFNFQKIINKKRKLPKPPQTPKCKCNMVFDSLPMLHSHKVKEGHINVPNRHKCPECDAEFITKGDLAKHRQQYHHDKLPITCAQDELIAHLIAEALMQGKDSMHAH